MKKELSAINQKGFSLAEIVVAIAIFGLLVSSVATALMVFSKSVKFSGKKQQAILLAEEGLEAVRNMRDADFASLTDGTFGIATTSNAWGFSGSLDTTGIFNRHVDVTTISPSQKQVTSTVNWQQGNLDRLVSLSTYFTNWSKTGRKGGMLVFGNGTTTNDSVMYKIYDGSGNWSAAASVADIDSGTTNRAMRAALLYSSLTRNEKVLLTRHYNGTTQYIYAQVFDGTSWGNVQLLASWNAATFLDVRNFSGTYLSNGDFMVVYSDNSTTPKFRTWDGSVWSSQISMKVLTAVPVYIKIAARPGTSEVLAATFDASQLTKTEYYNGAGYSSANWTSPTSHGTGASNNTKENLDFVWSPNNPLIGALIYSGASNDRKVTIKIVTANGAGGINWGTAVGSTPTQPSGRNIGPMALKARNGTNEFIACDKDNNASPNIYCYESNYTPAWSNPTNQTISSPTDNGIQRSFDIAFENSGDQAIAVYSDTTSVPKFKTYNPTSNAWTSTSTSLSTLSASLETVLLKPDSSSDDVLILAADNSRRLYTIFWDGTNNLPYSSPSGMDLTLHGSSGSAVLDYWYDFVWDNY